MNYYNKPINIFNFLRGVGCLSVLIYHVAWLCQQSAPTITDIPWPFYLPAWSAVWMFFIISGYLIGKGFVNGKYKAETLSDLAFFYKKRAIRILPIYYFVLAIDVFFINAPFYLNFGNHMLAKSVFLSLVPSGGATAMTGNLWFLCTAVRLYLLAPMVYYFVEHIVSKLPHKKLSVVGIIVSLLVVSFCFRLKLLGKMHWADFIYSKWFFNLDFFIGGFLLNYLFNAEDTSIRRIMRPVSMLVFLCFLAVNSYFMKVNWDKDVGAEDLKVYCATLVFLVTAFVIWAFDVNRVSKQESGNIFANLFTSVWGGVSKLFELFGIMSMGIYLSHPQTIVLLINRFANPEPKRISLMGHDVVISAGSKNFLYILCFAIFFSLLWGVIIHFMLEKPIEVKREKIVK